jgi:non-heme chloroperoxidase
MAGRSSRPPDGYDSATLAHDILTVLDKLAIGRVVLVGHSFAGAEMTTFAATSPARVQALVYLESAYDFTVQPSTPLPQQVPSAQELASVAGMNDYLQRTLGMRFPESEWRATSQWDTGGAYCGSNTSNDVYQKALKAVDHPLFDKVTAPALAIYAPSDTRSVFPNYDNFDGENKARAERYAAELQARADSSMARFRVDMTHGRVVVLNPANHAVFFSNEADVVRLIRGFVAEVVDVRK